MLEPKDVIVFFCARQELKHWNYYFVGFGTVKETLRNRETIWNDAVYQQYRNFYNVLVKSGQQFEPFGKMHDDWKKRAEAPYIFFESSEPLTKFNITTPLKVATFDPEISPLEIWNVDTNHAVKKLHHALFRMYSKVDRNLRTANPYIAHPHIRIRLSEREIDELRREIQEIC